MSTARVYTVDRATTDNGYERRRKGATGPKVLRAGVRTCGKCGDPLPKGSAYRYYTVGFRSHYTRVRCTKPACFPRPSELESSAVSEVYAAQEAASDALDGLPWTGDADDIRSQIESAVSDVVDAIDSVAQTYRDAAEPFGGAGDNADRADTLESASSDLGSWSPDGSDPEGCGDVPGDPSCDLCSEAQAAGDDACDEHGARHDEPTDGCDRCDEKAQEWVNEQVAAATEAIDGVELP